MPLPRIDERVPIYRLFGRNVAVEPPLVTRVAPSLGGSVDLLVEPMEDLNTSCDPGEPFFRSAPLAPGDESWLTAFRSGERYVLRFADAADFLIEASRVRVSLRAEGDRATAETYLLGIVLALWLERSGSVCLHSSAVAAPAGGIGFLGFNRAGKSSLAASFLATGALLLTDDVLALDGSDQGTMLAQPSYPQMRLWPTTAVEFVAAAHELEPVHPAFDKKRVPIGGDAGLGAFQDRAVELRALFLPERGGSEIALSRLSPRDAAIELVRHSFLGALGEAAIGAGQRFERLIAVAERVPALRLAYPNGLEHLPAVRAAILERLEAL